MKIAVIVGSIRKERRTHPVAEYVHRTALERPGDAVYELVDLADFGVPLLTASVHPMAANKTYGDANVQRWSDAIDGFDAFVFVTPEYNHGVPGAFKNAVDTLGDEWVGKPVCFVGHGSVGGVRAIEQWRPIVSNFSMPMVRNELNFNSVIHWKGADFTPDEGHADAINAMLDQLERLVIQTRS